MAKALWYIVEGPTNNPITFTTGNGILIGPYVFTHERDALMAIDEFEWPPDISEKIVARPGSLDLFMTELTKGFPRTVPRPPDCFSLNARPFHILRGLCPINPQGAEFADRISKEKFWTLMVQQHQSLIGHVLDSVRIASGEAFMN